MTEYDRRHGGHGGHGGYNHRKRRYRGDDDDHDRRQQRRRIDSAPLPVKVRRQLLALAESPLRRWHEEVQSIARAVTDNHEHEELLSQFLELSLQLILEQPLKAPFVAAVILVINTIKPEIVDQLLALLATQLQQKIQEGYWRDVKLYLKFLASLQGCLSGDGIFPLLEELFSRAADLQMASSDDTIGTEIVKIILLTLPNIMATDAETWKQNAADLMDKTDIIASEPHPLQALIDPQQITTGGEGNPASTSIIGLLQKQLQVEASNNWELTCLPRPWEMPLEEIETKDQIKNAPKHDLPSIVVPETVVAGPVPLFPEVYFSVYAQQDIETVPPVTNIAAFLIRDGLADTINSLHVNRNVTARYLIDLDCFFPDGTFIKRATPFDRLRDMETGKSTWKPEDVAVDTVFSQLFQLPAPEQKLVYYHSVLTEACKLAPAAIAPSLGRAIRFLYRNTTQMDMELTSRFTDWFSHHLSNFGYTWKWTEWVDDVNLSELHPYKAFILGALDKEIRLSFAQRIKGTLPEPLQHLIGPEKEEDVPTFKYSDPDNQFYAEGQEIATLLRKKAPDEDFQPVIERIHTAALDQGLDPLVASTNVFMTAVCWVGSKSLSHVLACIDRTKGRLVDVGSASEAARAQIISSVTSYWQAHPGVAITIIEKLLNYSILTPLSVAQWLLVEGPHANGCQGGEALAQAHNFELLFNTVSKVTGRVRQLVSSPAADPESVVRETTAMRDLFAAMEVALDKWIALGKEDMAGDGTVMIGQWAERWLRVFKRRTAIEEAFLAEASRAKAKAENGSA